MSFSASVLGCNDGVGESFDPCSSPTMVLDDADDPILLDDDDDSGRTRSGAGRGGGDPEFSFVFFLVGLLDNLNDENIEPWL